MKGDDNCAADALSRCDVLVIGGGPAGTTIATLLNERGWDVVVLEQDHHPRFHIGESLLPMNLPILKRLGVLDDVARIGVIKHGAEFCPAGLGRRHRTASFERALNCPYPYAYQVRRSEFDDLLFRNCRAQGVTALEGVRVEEVVLQRGSRHLVQTRDENGRMHRWHTRFVVDASGRDTVLARKLALKRKNPRHQSAAIFGHFHDVERRHGRNEGNISIYWFAHGWFWVIPLRDGMTSVGAVCWPEYLKTRSGSLEAFFWQTVALCPQLARRMRGARIFDRIHGTGNYSYSSRRMYGDGYILIGDAYAFVDPVFSTGVFFAMNSAVLGADAVDAHLRDARDAAALFTRFEREVQRGIRVVSWFIYRFTAPGMQRLFMEPRAEFGMQQAVVSMLAGGMFGRPRSRLPLVLVKIAYYLKSASMLSRAWMSYRRRQRNVSMDLHLGEPRADEG